MLKQEKKKKCDLLIDATYIIMLKINIGFEDKTKNLFKIILIKEQLAM